MVVKDISNWLILTLPADTANWTPTITIAGKSAAWQIYGLKSNLPSDCKVTFQIPSLPHRQFQSEGVPIYALRQPEIPPNNKIVQKWTQWQHPLRVPAEFSFQIALNLPANVGLPPNPFISLYYETEKEQGYISKFPNWLGSNQAEIVI